MHPLSRFPLALLYLLAATAPSQAQTRAYSLPETGQVSQQEAATLLSRYCVGEEACIQDALAEIGGEIARGRRGQRRRQVEPSAVFQELAGADGLLDRQIFASFRHPRQSEADQCLREGSVLFADACRDLAYFDVLLEDWDTPFAAGVDIPNGTPSVFEVIGVSTDELYAEPSLVLVQALAHGAFVEVLLSDAIPEPVTVRSAAGAASGGRGTRRERTRGNRGGDRVLRLAGSPIPSEFGPTAGTASVAMVNAVVQGTRSGDDGGRDVFVENQLSFLTPSGDMVVAYDKVRTGTAITGWTWDECYGPGYEPENWGDAQCQTSFAIPSTQPPSGRIDINVLLWDRDARSPWVSRGSGASGGRVGSGTTGTLRGRAGEALTVGAASVGGCESAISDSGALRETVAHGMCMLAGLAGAEAGAIAYTVSSSLYAFYKSTLTLGGPEVVVEDLVNYGNWLVSEGYEMGSDMCNESMNGDMSIEVTGCQLDVLNNREGAANAACQSGAVRVTFTASAEQVAEQCGGRTATCDATGTQTCSREGDCDTCTQDWDDAVCTCN